MIEKFSLGVFLKKYSDNDKCLEKIKDLRWSNGIFCKQCEKITKFYKIKGRPVFECEFGGSHQVSPLAGTIFKKIRLLMTETKGDLLSGNVEIDETFVGGKGKNRAFKPNFSEIPKEVIMGMVERGGKLHTKHIPNTGKYTLLEEIQKNVDKNASIMTDNYAGYTQLSKYGYHHFSVNHSASEYTRGEIHTQNIEGVWSQLKRGITGVYRHVSKEYLQSYSDEFSWRYNHRNDINIFDSLLKQVAEVKILKFSQLSP